MIAWLSGKIIDISTANCLVLDVNGVGYAVDVTTSSYTLLAAQQQPVGLFIQTIVREDAITLFGFLEQEERALFRSLIKVNGIGPKSAMAILSAMSPSMFIQCVSTQDKQMLTQLPGVGKKTAERILIEMQDILKNSAILTSDVVTPITQNSAKHEALSALQALGYKYQEAHEAIKKLDNESQDPQVLIKSALKILAKY
jgi:Holliday junction DNA helicase RuvA